MPVYEFYCADCHTIFNFFSRRVNTKKRPSCPRCSKPDLEKQVSSFAISGNLPDQPDNFPEIDQSRMEQAMLNLAGEMEKVNEDDPKAMASLLRKFSSITGMELGDGAEEAIGRLEAGEDPEQIEAEMGDLFDSDSLFTQKKLKNMRKRYLPPEQDETLYTLD